MIFEYQPDRSFDYMQEFAGRFNLPYSGNHMEFNTFLGNGFIKTINIAEGFRIVISRTEYKQTLVIKKKEADFADDLVVFRFILENPLHVDPSFPF